MPITESFDFDWRFSLGDGQGLEAPGFDDSSWRLVDLPHDWSVEGPFSPDSPAGGSGAWAPSGVAWYRRRFVPGADREGLGARLEFDGAYRRAEIYLNGRLLRDHRLGFASFAVELEGLLDGGAENLVAVRVDNSEQPRCRWYTGSGLYRRARLAYHGELRVEPWGIAIQTLRAGPRGARVRVSIEAEDARPRREACIAEVSIFDPVGSRAALASLQLDERAGGGLAGAVEARIRSPRLWSPETPELYKVELRLLSAGGAGAEAAADLAEASFGLRFAEFRPGRGFFLNGKETKLKGVCLHGDGGCVGAAVPEALWRSRLARLKELGCNAIRCAHNPPDPGFLDLCDRLGFLVIDEAFDKWEGAFSKPEEWYMRSPGFAELWEEGLAALVKRDRNHPSVILWSVGNETGQPGTPELEPWLGRLCRAVRELDPTRPVSAAFVHSSDPDPDRAARLVAASAAEVDVLCLNYQEARYRRIHDLVPGKVILGSEAWPHWRGTEANIHAFGDRNPWYEVLERPYVAGQFLWPGIDYLGESNRWPLKGWDSGILDTAGRLKPSGHFHRSAWSDAPFVGLALRDHGMGRGEAALSWGGYSLSRHWNWPEFELAGLWPEVGGRLVEVEAQTNCDSVELFLNGVSYGERRAADYPNRAVVFCLPYRPGLLRALGRRGGIELASDELRTAGPAAALRLSADRDGILADGQDIALAAIELVDAQGTLVPRSDRPLEVRVEGPGRLLGLDNGLLDSDEEYAGGKRSTSGGFCLALVGRAREPGRSWIFARTQEGELEARIAIDAAESLG